MSIGAHHAAESRNIQASRIALTEVREHLDKILPRLQQRFDLTAEPEVLDIGAAQGEFLIACMEKGLRAVGVEPFAQAHDVALQLAAECNVEIDLRDGEAEALPLDDASVDLIHAQSVIEHVRDPQQVFAEAFRVLRPGGVFWFHTASSVCPAQMEIRGLPFFGWYPDRLKRRIMRWAVANRPEWVGGTTAPALHWFTPRKAKRMLTAAGFIDVTDRWDLRRPEEGGTAHRVVLKLIQTLPPVRLLADVLRMSCTYAAMKPRNNI